MSDKEIILACAVRYALSRHSYIVSTVCNYVKGNIKDLSIDVLNAIRKDILAQQSFVYNNDIDEKTWLDLLNTVQLELNKVK